MGDFGGTDTDSGEEDVVGSYGEAAASTPRGGTLPAALSAEEFRKQVLQRRKVGVGVQSAYKTN